MAIWIALASITMMFAGLASAYLVMRGAPSWQAIALPSLLWANTLVLLASSGSIEFTRRLLREGRMPGARLWMTITAVLGVGFLAGQVLAWMQLNASGVRLASTLQSSFLYIFTATHGVHLAGGLVALAVLWRQMLGKAQIPSTSDTIDIFATYWHFMDGLWICLLLLLVLA